MRDEKALNAKNVYSCGQKENRDVILSQAILGAFLLQNKMKKNRIFKG